MILGPPAGDVREPLLRDATALLTRSVVPRIVVRMSQFIYVLRPVRLAMLTEGPTDDERTAVGAHVAYLKGLLSDGRALLFGRTQTADETTFGIVVFEADDIELATATMSADPSVQHGVMTAELHPFHVAGMAGRV